MIPVSSLELTPVGNSSKISTKVFFNAFVKTFPLNVSFLSIVSCSSPLYFSVNLAINSSNFGEFSITISPTLGIALSLFP